MTQVYFIKNKSETFAKVRELKAMIEKQSGTYLKVVRLDGGGEHDSKYFASYCKEHGIH